MFGFRNSYGADDVQMPVFSSYIRSVCLDFSIIEDRQFDFHINGSK